MSARSIVASALLGTHPPVLRGQLLVRLCALFGVPEGTTRVALSRMVAARELRAVDGRYELASPSLLARQAAQERGRKTPRGGWRGDWIMAVVTVERRDAPARIALRDASTTLRLAELREGVWTRPANLEWDDDAARAVFDDQCTWFVARPDDPPALAERLWDLRAWSSQAEKLITRMERSRAALDSGRFDAIPEGFVTSAAVLRLLRADPLLPGALLGHAWPGATLRRVYDDYDVALRALLREFFRPTPDPPSREPAPARSRARPARRAPRG